MEIDMPRKHLSVVEETSKPAPAGVFSDRMRSAATRAIESSQRLKRKADQLSEELDEVTPANGVILTELPADDSIVVSVQRALDSRK